MPVVSEETWVINETFSTQDVYISEEINFTWISSGTVVYETGIVISFYQSGFSGYIDFASTQGVFRRYRGVSTWVIPDARIVTFSTPPTGDLLTWLQNNATKQ